MQENKTLNIGLLILRIGIGLMFIYHGFPKLTGGPQVWTAIGGATGIFGIKFTPVFWGFMAAFSEFFGGICILLGIFMKPACILLFVTMFVAGTMHLSKGDGLNTASHAIELAFVFLSLFFMGPGKYSLGSKIKCRFCK